MQKFDDLLLLSRNRPDDDLSTVLADAASKVENIRLGVLKQRDIAKFFK